MLAHLNPTVTGIVTVVATVVVTVVATVVVMVDTSMTTHVTARSLVTAGALGAWTINRIGFQSVMFPFHPPSAHMITTLVTVSPLQTTTAPPMTDSMLPGQF